MTRAILFRLNVGRTPPVCSLLGKVCVGRRRHLVATCTAVCIWSLNMHHCGDGLGSVQQFLNLFLSLRSLFSLLYSR